MKGYSGYSQSYRAVYAKAAGRLPMSLITAKVLKTFTDDDYGSVNKFKAYAKRRGGGEWHHCSKFFNEVDFFDVPQLLHQAGLKVITDVLDEFELFDADDLCEDDFGMYDYDSPTFAFIPRTI